MEWWRAAAAGAGALGAARLATPAMGAVLRGAGLARRRRLDGRLIPTAAGLAPVLAGAAASAAADSDARAVRRVLLPVLAAALAGLVDDAAAGGSARGWRGHWRSLLAGRPDTGVLKAALVGLAAAAAASGGTRQRGAARSVLAAAGSALAANALNQLDTGPGRAALAFLAAYGAVGWMAEPARREAWLGALPLAAAVAGYLPHDRRGDVMLGDAGANALGAALGWVAGESLPLGRLLVWTAALLAANAWLDRWSLSGWLDARRRQAARIGPGPAYRTLGSPGRAAGQGARKAGANLASAPR